LTNRNITSKT